MSEEGEGPAQEVEPRQTVGNLIAACRAAWTRVYDTQSTMEGLDEEAFAVYIKAAEELEELGYSVEECDDELDIYKHEEEVAYDPDLMVEPATYLNTARPRRKKAPRAPVTGAITQPKKYQQREQTPIRKLGKHSQNIPFYLSIAINEGRWPH